MTVTPGRGKSNRGDETAGHGGIARRGQPTDLARLRELRGRDQDVLFCQLMIRHHQGGVTMADGLLARTDSRKVCHLAEAIKTSQVSEIDAVNQALTRLGALPLAETWSLIVRAGRSPA